MFNNVNSYLFIPKKKASKHTLVLGTVSTGT